MFQLLLWRFDTLSMSGFAGRSFHLAQPEPFEGPLQ